MQSAIIAIRMSVCLYVHLSVCLSRAGIVSKQHLMILNDLKILNQSINQSIN